MTGPHNKPDPDKAEVAEMLRLVTLLLGQIDSCTRKARQMMNPRPADAPPLGRPRKVKTESVDA